MSNSATTRAPIRWWPAALVLGLLGCYWIWIWSFHPGHRQDKNLQTMASLVLALCLVFLWSLLYSRLRVKIRLIILGTVLLLTLFLFQTVRIRGVTGDLLPVFQWRWTKAATTPVASTTPPLAAPLIEVAYPQFLGPQGDGIVDGLALATDWKARPPIQLWRQPIGPAWAGFAIYHNYAITMEQSGETELITARELLSGRILWTHADPARFSTVIAGDGPRTVPTIRSNRVYAMGATGLLNCLNLTNGQPIWSKNVLTDAQAELPEWGVSCSPLVTGTLVVACAGGTAAQSLVAYHAETGERVWAGGNSRAHFSSPVYGQLAGVPQILIFNAVGISAHDYQNGQVLWNYPWRGGHPHITNPLLVGDDRVLVSSGYGTGSELLQIRHPTPTNWTVAQVWKSNRLKSKFANLILLDGYVYGLDDGILVCLKLETGELMWKEGRYGHGQIILVNGVLLVMAESGDVVLVEANPKEHRELTRFEALADKTWNPPALAGPYLLVRNDKEAACYQLPIVEF